MQQDSKAAAGSCSFHGDFLPKRCKEGPKAISEHPEGGSVHLLLDVGNQTQTWLHKAGAKGRGPLPPLLSLASRALDRAIFLQSLTHLEPLLG